MHIQPTPSPDLWTKPANPKDQVESGYDKWLSKEISEGVAELDAGKGIPAGDVWAALGLE